MHYTATYSPEDNKLRLSAMSRLDAETYARVKAAGFIWAPKQEIFVAPMWTPEREDLLLELAGEIGDEDTSLVERAEARAERFEEYSDRRAEDAQQAKAAVDRIADGIPLGQPILVGHHSERHARKDAEKIENGVRRAVKMWETSEYWKYRAAGAIRAAKYKELPSVRARRIKTLEADLRKQQCTAEDQDKRIALWSKPMTDEQARYVAGNTNTTDMDTYFGLDKGTMNAQQAAERVISQATAYKARCERWIQHLSNRLEYERAMLADAGGIVADRNKPEKGGACRCWASPFHMAGWSYIVKVNKISVTVLDNWGNSGPNFTRTIEFDKLKAIMSASEVEEARKAGRITEDANKTGFLLAPLADAPTPEPKQAKEPEPQAAAFAALRETLKAGVQVVSAPQLFPTPAELAARMVEEADIQSGQCVLEPSAGTGNLVRAVLDRVDTEVLAYEINSSLCAQLTRTFPSYKLQARCADFLQVSDFMGCYDRILMNPPFENGADIKHIQHAVKFLKPGGRLVAICAGGPRQKEQLEPLASLWEPLPAGTFKDAGTSVNTVLVVIEGTR